MGKITRNVLRIQCVNNDLLSLLKQSYLALQQVSIANNCWVIFDSENDAMLAFAKVSEFGNVLCSLVSKEEIPNVQFSTPQFATTTSQYTSLPATGSSFSLSQPVYPPVSFIQQNLAPVVQKLQQDSVMAPKKFRDTDFYFLIQATNSMTRNLDDNKARTTYSYCAASIRSAFNDIMHENDRISIVHFSDSMTKVTDLKSKQQLKDIDAEFNILFASYEDALAPDSVVYNFLKSLKETALASLEQREIVVILISNSGDVSHEYDTIATEQLPELLKEPGVGHFHMYVIAIGNASVTKRYSSLLKEPKPHYKVVSCKNTEASLHMAFSEVLKPYARISDKKKQYKLLMAQTTSVSVSAPASVPLATIPTASQAYITTTGAPEAPKPLKQKKPSTSSGVPCFFHMQGTCTKGEKCNFSHETGPSKLSKPKGKLPKSSPSPSAPTAGTPAPLPAESGMPSSAVTQELELINQLVHIREQIHRNLEYVNNIKQAKPNQQQRAAELTALSQKIDKVFDEIAQYAYQQGNSLQVQQLAKDCVAKLNEVRSAILLQLQGK